MPPIHFSHSTHVADVSVAGIFASCPPRARRRLMRLRELIFRAAAATPGVGPIDECLKWGEPAYRPLSGSGSTVRLGWKASRPDEYAMLFNCRTTLVDEFRARFPHDFRFDGRRALVFDCAAKVPEDALRHCVVMALTYHRRQARRHAA